MNWPWEYCNFILVKMPISTHTIAFKEFESMCFWAKLMKRSVLAGLKCCEDSCVSAVGRH